VAQFWNVRIIISCRTMKFFIIIIVFCISLHIIFYFILLLIDIYRVSMWHSGIIWGAANRKNEIWIPFIFTLIYNNIYIILIDPLKSETVFTRSCVNRTTLSIVAIYKYIYAHMYLYTPGIEQYNRHTVKFTNHRT